MVLMYDSVWLPQAAYVPVSIFYQKITRHA